VVPTSATGAAECQSSRYRFAAFHIAASTTQHGLAGLKVAPLRSMGSHILKPPRRAQPHQPELTADVVLHLALVLLLAMLIIWRV